MGTAGIDHGAKPLLGLVTFGGGPVGGVAVLPHPVEAYRRAKGKLFSQSEVALLNIDDLKAPGMATWTRAVSSPSPAWKRTPLEENSAPRAVKSAGRAAA